MPSVSTYAAGLKSPDSIALDSAGNLYVAESAGKAASKITPAGVNSNVATSTSKGNITGIAVDSLGNIFTCFADSSEIYKNNAPWTSHPLIQDARDVATDSAGNVYVAAAGTNSVLKITSP